MDFAGFGGFGGGFDLAGGAMPMAFGGDMGAIPPAAPAAATQSLASVDKIRNVFPETWLWTNSSVGYNIEHFLFPWCLVSDSFHSFPDAFVWISLKKLDKLK